MLMVCMSAIMDVINRQYEHYFNLDVTEQLKIETQSARPHNIDAEEMVGMFSAAKQRAPNSTPVISHPSSGPRKITLWKLLTPWMLKKEKKW